MRRRWFALFVTLVACGPPEEAEHLRQRVLGAPGWDPVQLEFEEPARMTVVYWPASGQCLAREGNVVRRLVELEREYPDTRFLSVVTTTAPEERYGVPLPGKVIRLDYDHYWRQLDLAPLPRVEVWDAAGRLLLFKALPDIGDQAAILTEDILLSRALTAPLDEVERSTL